MTESLQRKFGAILSYINLFIGTIVNLVFIPIVLSTIGKSEYGIYQLVASIVSYLAILEGTLSTVTVRFYSRYKAQSNAEKMRQTVATSRIVFFVISLLSVAVGLCLVFLLDILYASSLSALEIKHAQYSLAILLIQLFVEINGCIYTSIIICHEKFVFAKLIAIASTLLNPTLVLIIIRGFPYSMAMAGVHCLVSVCLLLVKIYYARVRIGVKPSTGEVEKNLLREMMVFSIGLLLSVIADQLFWKTDQIILTKTNGTTVTAIYSIGATIYTVFISLSTAISGVFLPRVSQLVVERKNDQLNSLFVKVGRYQFFVLSLALTGFILFGKEFINLWVGPDFNDVYIIVLLILAPLTPDLCEAVGLSVLQARNQFNFRAYLYIGMAILNFLLTYWLSIRYGGIGAALATCLCILFGSLSVLNVFYIKKQRLPIIRLFIELLKISIVYIPLIPLGILLNKLISTYSFTGLIIKIVVYCLLYAIALMFVLKKEERKQLIGLVRKFYRRGR
ncbi:MAG: polysaccharide biosynthesis protein [Prolixibacteraceae bacterium]|nr:polysaccharide biosynthesis protein [Prolixibacteraceae bacterium]